MKTIKTYLEMFSEKQDKKKLKEMIVIQNQRISSKIFDLMYNIIIECKTWSIFEKWVFIPSYENYLENPKNKHICMEFFPPMIRKSPYERVHSDFFKQLYIENKLINISKVKELSLRCCLSAKWIQDVRETKNYFK